MLRGHSWSARAESHCALGFLCCHFLCLVWGCPPHSVLFFLRGSVLEPEGTVEIKFRKKELVKAMRRIDPTAKKLVEQLGKRLPKLSSEGGRGRWHIENKMERCKHFCNCCEVLKMFTFSAKSF